MLVLRAGFAFGLPQFLCIAFLLLLRITEKLLSDTTDLGGVFNDYFINIAVNLKEPIENTDLSKL